MINPKRIQEDQSRPLVVLIKCAQCGGADQRDTIKKYGDRERLEPEPI